MTRTRWKTIDRSSLAGVLLCEESSPSILAPRGRHVRTLPLEPKQEQKVRKTLETRKFDKDEPIPEVRAPVSLPQGTVT